MYPLLLAVFLIAMQVLDALTTHYILSRGGVELNPLMDKLFDMVGVRTGLLISKGLATLFIILIYSVVPVWLLIALSVWYLLIVGNNLYHVLKLKGKL